MLAASTRLILKAGKSLALRPTETDVVRNWLLRCVAPKGMDSAIAMRGGPFFPNALRPERGTWPRPSAVGVQATLAGPLSFNGRRYEVSSKTKVVGAYA